MAPVVPPPVVHLRAVVALIGRFPALSGVDLSVSAGEVILVDGPNGAGKTTVLRLCAGLLSVSSGEAVVLGCDLGRERSEIRRRVGLLGHGAALYDDLTVTENVRFALRAAHAPTSGIDRALERVGLDGRLRRAPVGRLSAGQRRRTALAVLVARQPELWLLDEPHAALDAGARQILSEVVAEAAAGGASVILTSHELDVAEPMADRVVSMAGGRVVQERRAGRRIVTLGQEGVYVA